MCVSKQLPILPVLPVLQSSVFSLQSSVFSIQSPNQPLLAAAARSDRRRGITQSAVWVHGALASVIWVTIFGLPSTSPIFLRVY